MKNFLLVTCIVLTAVPLADTLMTKYGNYQLAQARERTPFVQADAGRNNSTLWQDQVNRRTEGCIRAILEQVPGLPAGTPITLDLLDYNLKRCLMQYGVFI